MPATVIQDQQVVPDVAQFIQRARVPGQPRERLLTDRVVDRLRLIHEVLVVPRIILAFRAMLGCVVLVHKVPDDLLEHVHLLGGRRNLADAVHYRADPLRIIRNHLLHELDNDVRVLGVEHPQNPADVAIGIDAEDVAILIGFFLSLALRACVLRNFIDATDELRVHLLVPVHNNRLHVLGVENLVVLGSGEHLAVKVHVVVAQVCLRYLVPDLHAVRDAVLIPEDGKFSHRNVEEPGVRKELPLLAFVQLGGERVLLGELDRVRREKPPKLSSEPCYQLCESSDTLRICLVSPALLCSPGGCRNV